jgi:cell division protein DivIC
MGAQRKRNVSKIHTTYVQQQEYAEIASARKRKLLKRRLAMFFVFASILSYLMVSSYISQTTKLDAIKVQKKLIDKQLTEVNIEQDILNEDIIKLNDDDYIAKLARKEYFFSEKNEVIFSIPEEKQEKRTNF